MAHFDVVQKWQILNLQGMEKWIWKCTDEWGFFNGFVHIGPIKKVKLAFYFDKGMLDRDTMICHKSKVGPKGGGDPLWPRKLSLYRIVLTQRCYCSQNAVVVIPLHCSYIMDVLTLSVLTKRSH